MLPAGGLGVSPSLKNPPRLGDYGVDYDYFSSLIGVISNLIERLWE